MQETSSKAVAAIVGGGGGGRPNMAQAGGKNPEKAHEAVEAAAGILEQTDPLKSALFVKNNCFLKLAKRC